MPVYTMDLTDRQLQVYTTIDDFQRTYGYSPTIREIGKLVGLASTSSVASHIDRLERMGYIKRTPLSPRSIVIVRKLTSAS